MGQMIAEIPEFGGLTATLRFVVLIVLMVPWLRLAIWVRRDARRLFRSANTWNTAVLGAGSLGMLLWLIMPFFLVGALFYVVLCAGAMLIYVAHRNGHVDADSKVLTRKHLASVLSRRRSEKLEIEQKVVIYSHEEKVVHPPGTSRSEQEDVRTYNLVQDLLHDMVWRRASEATVTPAGQVARRLYVIDGVPTERPAMPLDASERIAQYLKEVAGMEVADHRRPQDGTLSVDLHGGRADMELTTAGTTNGQRMMFRLIQEAVRTELDSLGMPEDILEEMQKVSRTENGLFIVSGRRGVGVTSTLYSLLRQRDAFIQNIMTIEHEPAVELENITQFTYEDSPNVAKAVRGALSEDYADVLMVDQCPDSETAKMLAEAAAKKPVLVGMRAGDSFTALARWVQLCGDPALAVRILRGISCQMLVRKLCADCRESYHPDPQRLAKLNLSGENIDVFYRPGKPAAAKGKGPVEPCGTCQGSGYRGRTAVFELLRMNKEIRQLIIEGGTVAQIRAACRKNKMLYLQEQTLRKVIDGTTSIQEVVRVTQQMKKK